MRPFECQPGQSVAATEQAAKPLPISATIAWFLNISADYFKLPAEQLHQRNKQKNNLDSKNLRSEHD